MEPRAAVGAFEDNRFTLYVCSQGVIAMRANIADVMGVEAKDVRILTGQIGGSFGMKAMVFPEYIRLLHAGARAGPAGEVDRSSVREVLFPTATAAPPTSPANSRSMPMAILAVRLTSFSDVGAFLSPFGPFMARRMR